MRVTIPLVGLFVLMACDLRATENAPKKTGTIEATIDSPYAKRSEGVVFINEVEGKFEIPKKNPVMDQKKLVFIPHVLPILVGTTVHFPNNDVVRHNVFSLKTKNSVEQFNLGTYATGVTKKRTFKTIGPVQLLCNVHAEMSAFIIICQNPYFAVTDKKTSSGTIENVPPGSYAVTFWHNRLRPKTVKVTVKPGETAKVTFSKLLRKR
jgi:plastocyanin